MNDLSIPKRSVQATVHMLNGPARQFELFLSEMAETHRGPEKPSDLLLRNTRFLPAKEWDKAFAVLNTDAISWMTVDASVETQTESLSAEDLAASLSVSQDVDVTMSNGELVKGTLVYLQPQGRQRLQDFLHDAPRFFVLRDGERAHIVNVAHVAVVVPRSSH
jgi:hypothetical protein